MKRQLTHFASLLVLMFGVTGCKSLGLGGFTRSLPHIANSQTKQKKSRKHSSGGSSSGSMYGPSWFARKKLTKKYWKMRRPHETAISILFQVKNKKQKAIRYSRKYLLRIVRGIKKLDGSELVKWCQSDESQTFRPRHVRGEYDEPKVMCGVVLKRKTYIRTFVLSIIKSKEAYKMARFQKYKKRLKTSYQLTEKAQRELGNSDETIATMRKGYAPFYDEIGEKMPSDAFSGITKGAKGYRSLLRRAARRNRFPRLARFRSGACARAFRKSGGRAGFRLVRYGMKYGYWSIRKNRFGRPTGRTRKGWAMLRKRGERHCRIYYLTVYAHYTGGGRFGHGFVPLEHFRKKAYTVSRCR